MICPKCGSINTYVIDGMNACRMCGWRGLPGTLKPYYVRHSYGQKEEEEAMGEKGCSNCHRDLDNHYGGHCFTCYTARKGLKKGTEEYNAALDAVRAKIADGGGRRGVTKKKMKPRAAKADAPCSNDFPGNAAVIDQLKEQREAYLAAAKKLDQAIELLS